MLIKYKTILNFNIFKMNNYNKITFNIKINNIIVNRCKISRVFMILHKKLIIIKKFIAILMI
jgi:hypothetical protein